MQRAIMVGDSQVAKLYDACKRFIKSGEDDGSVVYDFVCASGPVAGYLNTAGGKLRLEPAPAAWKHAYVEDEALHARYAKTRLQIDGLGTKGNIDLAAYDVVIVTGGHLFNRWNVAYEAINATHLSAECIRRTCQDIIRSSRHYKWISGLQSPDSPRFRLISCPEPILNECSPRISTEAYAEKRFPPVQTAFAEILKGMQSELLPISIEMLSPAMNATSARFRVATENDYVHINREGADLVFRALHVLVRKVLLMSHSRGV